MLDQPHSSVLSPDLPEASSGGVLVSADGQTLPLRGVRLRTDACAGLAQVKLRQEFENRHERALSVVYQIGVPTDAAVVGYTLRVGERKIVGRVEIIEDAREQFEQAILEGRTAALLEQDRSSLFHQEVGNVAPGERVVVTIELVQRLRWLTDGQWEWRFPTTVAPRYQGVRERVPDAGRIGVGVTAAVQRPRLDLNLSLRDALDGATPSSPSHALNVRREKDLVRVAFEERGGVSLDRDVVVRWPVGSCEIGLSLDRARPVRAARHAKWAYGLLTVVPPRPDAVRAPAARDVVVLIDTSGSMHGSPLRRACQLASGLVAGLSSPDRLELLRFSYDCSRWREQPVEVSAQNRESAVEWLRTLRASGGTEMVAALEETMAPPRPGACKHIVLVTDGLIGFEDEVTRLVERTLPPAFHLHVVGVGSAINRSLSFAAARSGRGSEAMIGIDEPVEPHVARLLVAFGVPVLSGLELSGDAVRRFAPAALPDILPDEPLRIALALDPRGGPITLRGRTADGPWEEVLDVPPTPTHKGSWAPIALFGRECVEDLECRRARDGASPGIDSEIERIGLDFQIATRRTAWVAVSDQRDVDPREPTRRTLVPQQLAHGLSIERLGLRGASDSMLFEGHRGIEDLIRAAEMHGFTCDGIDSSERRLEESESGQPRPELKDDREVSAFPLRAETSSPLRRRAPESHSPKAPRRPPKRSFWRAALRLLLGLPAPAEEESRRAADRGAASRAPVGAPAARASARRVLRGRRTLRDAQRAAFEVAIEAAFEWRCPERVLVRFEDGRRSRLRVDASASTRSLALSPGDTLRIVLELQAESGKVCKIERTSGDEGADWCIEIRGGHA